jgi:hypothetical protein
MGAQVKHALDSSANEHSSKKRKTICCPISPVETSHSSASASTTIHRYLLTGKLAVTARIDWRTNEAETDATAFFRSVARRLIGIH